MMNCGKVSTGLPSGPWWTNVSFDGLLRSPDPAGCHEGTAG
jgi:hypothetical protein